MMILQIGRKSQSRSEGFTLIELIIVAAIIVVLVAVSSPIFRASFRDLELKDAAYNISKLITYGQQRAIIEEKAYRLLFDFEKKSYYLLVEDEKNQKRGFERIKGRFGKYFYLPEGVKFKGKLNKITFLPNGRCDKISLYAINQKNKIIEIKTNGRAGYVEVSEVKEE